MASKKGTKGSKGTRSSKGGSKKGGSKGAKRAPVSAKLGTKALTKLPGSKLRPPEHVMYGVAIREAIARGDLAEMRNIAVQARRHLNDVQTALRSLESKLGGGR
ncbi:MAG TPA: DUF1843 domain-containing protein [Pyrinomonadaceae bacterium]|nr:DUF1843 domain-containing protein [Pyrinomonadaceae bacterium]